MENNNLISVKQASMILNVSPATLRRWDIQGKLKAQRHPMSNYRIYKLDEIKKLAQKVEGK